MRWHVQQFGSGPVVVLLHGTGASTHSMAPLAARLATRFHVVVPDFPGHAFSERPVAGDLSLASVSRRLAELLAALDVRPALIVGHSAGAAVAARTVLDGLAEPAGLVGIAPAFGDALTDAASVGMPWIRPLVTGGLTARLAARMASWDEIFDRLVASTGSNPPAEMRELYHRLAADPGHIQATLAMMADWNSGRLRDELGGSDIPWLILVGAADRWIRPAAVRAVAQRLPATVVELPGGHVVHEEFPDAVAREIETFADRCLGTSDR